jgi:DNA modification methylase
VYAEGELGDALYRGFVRAAVDVALSENAAWYCWHASRRQAMLEQVWTDVGAFVHQQIIWVKSRPVLTYSVYRWAHEPCLMGWRRPHKPETALKVAMQYSTCWAIDSKEVESTEHPTSKPVALFQIPMEVHTQPGDICFEPFSGSGSQLMAAERVGRVCRAIEIEPIFCQVAIDRWEAFTGQRARKV